MPFILALLMSACAAVSAYGGDFNELDALLREDARLKMELAEERAKFADEERMLDAEISASEALVSELKKKQIPSKKARIRNKKRCRGGRKNSEGRSCLWRYLQDARHSIF